MIDESLTPLERCKEYIQKSDDYGVLAGDEFDKLTIDDKREFTRWYIKYRQNNIRSKFR